MGLVQRALDSTTSGPSAGPVALTLAIILSLPAAFCGFGFYASFEVGPISVFHVGYAALGTWLISEAIEQLGNAAPKKHGWAWLMGLSAACLLVAVLLLKPGKGSFDLNVSVAASALFGLMLFAGGLSSAMGPEFEPLRTIARLLLALLAFLAIPLAIWLMITGGDHRPWRPGPPPANLHHGPAKTPAIPAQGIRQ